MKKMKKIIVMLLAVALIVGLMPTAAFAGTYPEYVYDSKNVVGSCRITAQASTNGVLTDSTGGTVIRTDSATFFECGGGVWTFKAVPAKGYEFDGWDTLLTWQERDWVWKDWENFSAVNPNTVKGSYPLAVRHINNRNGNGAFHTDGLNMSVHHVWCSAPMATKVQNVQYNFIAKFKKIPFTLTVNHKVTVNDQDGNFLRMYNPPSTNPDITAYKVGDKIKPSLFQLNTPGLSFSGPDDEVILLENANVLTANYTAEEHMMKPAQLIVTHIAESYDQDGNLVNVDLSVADAVRDYVDVQDVSSSDFAGAAPAGFEGYKFDDTRNDVLTLIPSPDSNAINVYYIKEIYVNQLVDVTVNHIGITKNNAGHETARKTLETETFVETYYENDTLKPSDFKKGDTLQGFKFDASLDDEVIMVLPNGEEEENPNIINVYYEKTSTPYYPYYPGNVEEEAEEEKPVNTVLENIEDENTPLAQPEAETKPTVSPQTADSSASAWLLAIAAVAVAGLFSTKLVLKKEEE